MIGEGVGELEEGGALIMVASWVARDMDPGGAGGVGGAAPRVWEAPGWR